MQIKRIVFLGLLPLIGFASVTLGQAIDPPNTGNNTGLPTIIPVPDDETNLPTTIKRVLSIDPSVPVEIGGEPPFSIDPQTERTLELNGIQFSRAVPPVDLPVSANEAVELANKVTASNLTRQPIKITVEYVGYTDPSREFQNKKVWKVTYWGAPMLLEGPAPAPGQTRQVKQPSSKRAITWVLIDADKGKSKDPITTFSGGPFSD